MSVSLRRILFCLVLLFTIPACNFSLAPAQPTATPVPTETATPTVTATATSTATPEPTATPTITPSPAPTDTPTLEPTSTPMVREDGWMVYELPDEGYSLALPPDWIKFDLDPDKLTAALDKAKAQNPGMIPEGLGQQVQNLLAAGVKFYAIDFSLESVKAAQTGMMTNVNILASPLDVDISVDVLAQMSVNQAGSMAGVIKPITAKAIKLPVGDAQKLSYKMKLKNAAGQDVTAAFTQYMFILNKKAYAITLTTTGDRLPSCAATFDKIAESFEVLE